MQEDHSLSMQYHLLGCYMKDPDLFSKVDNLVRCTAKSSIFTTHVTRSSYMIIKGYHTKNTITDISILYKSLIKSGVDQSDASIVTTWGSVGYLSEEQVKEYVEALFADYAADYLTPILSSAVLNFSTSDPLLEMVKVKDAITQVELAINNVSKDRSILDVFDEAFEEIIGLKEGRIEQAVYSWGLKELDRKTGGILDGPNIVAATPGSGKTSLVINLAVANCLNNGIPFLFFSLEMKAKDLMKNIISNIAEINSRSVREGNVDDDQLISIKSVRSKLTELFQIDETDSITWQYVESKVRAFRKKHKMLSSQPLLVAIDFIQKMKSVPEETKGISQEQQVDIRMNELARIAKQENLRLIEISQFTRETSKRDNPRPKVTDLKGSSSIEQNAVTILLMHRPDQHGIFTNDSGIDLKGIVEINIAKARFSVTEPVYARFEGKYSKFIDHEMYEQSGIITGGEDSF